MGKFKDFMGGTGAGLLNEASKNLAKNNMEITYIPRDEIYKNPKNEYSISDIENLADLIYVMGLREPLGVKPEGSGYKLIEGERRLTAIDKLIADGKWEGDIPCIIREKELKVNLDILSDEEKEILEIAGTNAGQRKYSEADYLFEVEKLEPIYKKLKASGIGEFTYESDTGEKITQSLTGKKSRELLAERLNVSPAQVGKISKVANSGTEELKEAVKAADMIITTGGVSVGKKDIMHESLRLMGAERIFWRVKMKPGMPTLFSAYKKTSDITATDHCASEREIPIISLSGNPFGVAVSIELLIRPALEKMMQDPSIGLKEVNGIMADNFEKGIKGRRFIRAYLENGKFHLPNGLHSNGVLSSMAGCNCLIDTKTMENQESRSLNAGDKVSAILL